MDNAPKARYGPLLGALATLAWAHFLRVGEAATICDADIAVPGSIQFWNSKTGEEGYTIRPLSRYVDQVREWAYAFVVGSGKKSVMLVRQEGEAGLESGMAECLVGTAYPRARWHALCWGGAGGGAFNSSALDVASDCPSSDPGDRAIRGTLLVAEAPGWGPLARARRGAPLFLLVVVSTTPANLGYMVVAHIEIGPLTRAPDWGPYLVRRLRGRSAR